MVAGDWCQWLAGDDAGLTSNMVGRKERERKDGVGFEGKERKKQEKWKKREEQGERPKRERKAFKVFFE